MQIRVGTSGRSYKEWKDSFYPQDLKSADMLRCYAERFSSVEISNTLLPNAESPGARELGGPGPARLSLRPEGVPTNHPPQAAQEGSRAARVPPRDRRHPGRQAGAQPWNRAFVLFQHEDDRPLARETIRQFKDELS